LASGVQWREERSRPVSTEWRPRLDFHCGGYWLLRGPRAFAMIPPPPGHESPSTAPFHHMFLECPCLAHSCRRGPSAATPSCGAFCSSFPHESRGGPAPSGLADADPGQHDLFRVGLELWRGAVPAGGLSGPPGVTPKGRWGQPTARRGFNSASPFFGCFFSGPRGSVRAAGIGTTAAGGHHVP
jgi:hypothetical protein